MNKFASALWLLLSINTVSVCYAEENSNTLDKADYLKHTEPSERLITIMRQLFSIVHSEAIEENAKLTKEDMAELTETVEELLFYAELMSAKVPTNELEENEHVIFSAMASQLYTEALNIRQLAENYNFELTDNRQENIFYESLERLNRTCAACHQLFRDNEL